MASPLIVTKNNQASMLAQPYANIGDITYRADLDQNFSLVALPSSVLANWVQYVPSQVGPQGPAGTPGAQGAPGTSNVPWYDIQNFGGYPDNNEFRAETTTVNTTATSPDITLGAAKTFVNGQGVCIWKAGAATSQSTPSAPTLATSPVQGAQTIKYKIVGYDGLGGLTAASSQAEVTNAPAVFGSVAQAISSISQSGGVVTVQFAEPLNNTVTDVMTLHITGVTDLTQFNGIWPIASAPSTSEVTFALAGSAGSASGLTNALGRVSNAQIVTALSRDANGVISITTAQNHGWQVQSTVHPTIVIIENASPASLNGHWTLASASGSSATTNPTGCFSVVTGSAVGSPGTYGTANFMTAQVWESITVTCPALIGSPLVSPGLTVSDTYGYYIYSDSPNPGGSLVLIGKTLYQEVNFVDFGPYFGGGYVAPAYVPTTAPASAQNQMFTSTIKSGGGTTSLVLNNNVTSSVTGGTIMHDDGPALVAASIARTQVGFTFGAVLLSPNQNAADTIAYYIFNSPIQLPTGIDLMVGAGMIINETITWGVNGVTDARMVVPPGQCPALNPQFGRRNYSFVYGLGNPMIAAGLEATVDGMGFQAESNGQTLLMISGWYPTISNCAFQMTAYGNTIGLCFNGNVYQPHVTDCEFLGDNGFVVAQAVPGQSAFCPIVGTLVLRASDNPAQQGAVPAFFVMDGTNTGGGRGFVVDGQYQTGGFAGDYIFGDSIWNQAPDTPAIVMMCQEAARVSVRGVICDSSSAAAFGNLCESLTGVDVRMGGESGEQFPVVTGNRIIGLTTRQIIASTDAVSSVDTTQELFGSARTGGYSFAGTPSGGNVPASSATLQARPLIIGAPYGILVCPVAAPTCTAVTSGVGTIPAGTYSVQLTNVGWDGGESALLPDQFTEVTVNGSQGILVSWTPVSGVEGVKIYINTQDQGTGTLTGTSHTLTTFRNGDLGAGPSLDGTGLPSISEGLIVTPEIIMPSGANKSTITAGTLTGNRTASLPDASGTVLVGSASGIGNGSSGNIQAPAKSSGTGPTTPGTIVGWTEINIGGTLYWIPLAQ